MTDEIAKDFHELAVQVARLDERTQGLAREIDSLRREMDALRQDLRAEIREVRSEMRWMFGGLSVLMTVGLAVLGLVLKLT